MKLKGTNVSDGIALGEVYIFTPFKADVKEAYFEGSEAQYIVAYERAKSDALNELISIQDKMRKTDPEKVKIFVAHTDLLDDEDMDEEIIDLITDEKYLPDFAIETIFNQYKKMLAKSKNALIRERAADMEDVKNRLLRNYYGIEEHNISSLSAPVVLACHDLLPSDTATMDRKNILGFMTEVGGPTSHSAIIAKSYGIPAILGVCDLLSTVKNGQRVILDALKGEIILDPTQKQSVEYAFKRTEFQKERADLLKYLDIEGKTKDGVHVDIGMNIGSASIENLKNLSHVDYVGLFRSEFLYMGKASMPSEETQFEEYKKVLMSSKGHIVTLRSLDIGGDKTLSYWKLPKEDNPFLGCRAIRLCFENQEIFKTQLRAALRASVYGTLYLMFPMIESLDDIRRVKAIIAEVKADLDAQGIAYSDTMKTGVMIEIPSIAMIADQVAKEVDFASIGTNDLCQYLLACDRMNQKLAPYYQQYHPAVFRLIDMVAKAFNAEGKSLSVCGELGGDPRASLVLAGMGIKKLSMNISSVPRVKKGLSFFTMDELKTIATEVQTLGTHQEIGEYLSKQLAAKGI